MTNHPWFLISERPSSLLLCKGLVPLQGVITKKQDDDNGGFEPINSDIGSVGLCSVSVLPGCQSPHLPRCASRPKIKKIFYDTAENDDFDRDEIPTYEEVSKLYPRPGIYRPLVLIGPPGIGRNELKRRLIATDPEKYKTPIPCK